MSSLNFIGGEKGGVGKSVVSRVLAQYFIDKGTPFVGFDTDRSHASFARFYGDNASPINVDDFESLDEVVKTFEETPANGHRQRVIVDLAAQTAASLTRWIRDSEVIQTLRDMDVAVHFWHVADAGKDSAALLSKLVERFGSAPNYVVVKNLGRSSDFSELEATPALKEVLAMGGRLITLTALHDGCMRKIDNLNASFWSAANNSGVLGLLERQRVKSWLKSTYATFDTLPI